MKTLLAAVAVLVASVASAQVAVTTPDPINVDPQQARALAAVCASAYSQASGQPVATPTTAEQLAALPPGERVELQLIGLDGARQRRVLVRAQRKTADGRVEHEAMLEALSLEDAPTVCERLAVALVNKQSVEDTQTRKNVTAAEAVANRRRRVGSNKSFGVKTGFTGAVAQDVVVAPMGSLLFDARIEGERFFTQLGAGFLIPAVTGGATGYGGLTLDMGAGYYLVDGDFAPYLGLGVQPRLVFSGSVFNLVPYVQLGFTTSRKAGVRFNVEARVGQNVLPALNGFGLSGGTLPTEFTLNLGLGF